ncbi:glycosyltransferase family 4 protein [Dinghuibacter silviterrae]|uniref:Glycosyltransferase involved in cell wall biosynthesis n=1 Tax=Dinghuibacter silviterrae TaxID=1539049 RepID=A0A4V3GM40_9BACT|nr:glycosyltransferase family 4 protein [Dinghuibacter silviterrae]TDX01913.1 glycosyltransferase involved in cell wall biosynthesis [Dinghuibacter silviterrae]
MSAPTTIAAGGKIRVLEAIRQGKVGGGETHILNLVEHIDTTRFEPVVLAFTHGKMMETLDRMGVNHHVIPSNRAFDLSTWNTVRRLMQRERIDLVHVHGTRANTNILWAARMLRLPIIYTVHGWSFHDDQSWWVKKARIFVEKWITRFVNRTISVSGSNQETGNRYIPHFQSVVIPNGISLSQFDPGRALNDVRRQWGVTADACVLGFVGRMTLQKDPLALIEAFPQVLRANPRAVLVLVGEGELKEPARKRVVELGLEGKIIFEKFRTDVPDVLAAMDIFCLPSLWEGLPIGLMEAMAMRKACLATRVDGSKELIRNGENGLLVEPGEPVGLAEALVRLVTDTPLRMRLGSQARHTIEAGFDVTGMTRKIESLYLETLEHK